MKSTSVALHGERLPNICGWCGKRTRGLDSCDSCRGIEAHLRREPGPEHALPEGHWTPRGGVLVWVEGPEPTPGGRAPCGTPGGYYSHLRHAREEPCWDCRVAWAVAQMADAGEPEVAA